MEHEPGQLIAGKYRIVRLLGDGGMGSVYEATHEKLGTSVALKFLFPHLARVPGLTERVLREARVSANIRSAHVTQVFDVDQLPSGVPYLVMELLKGESLQRLLDREKRLSKDRAIDFALQILVGLEAAHAIGVVHRDLKPDNVFVTTSTGGPVIKLLDFGIAKVRDASEYKNLTRPGAVMGTPEYMPPEQAFSADQADARSDIYSVGVMLYEMLSGVLPAKGSTPQEIAAHVLSGSVTPLGEHNPGVPQGLINLVHRAIAGRPDLRPESALQMRAALAPFAGELSAAGRMAAAVTVVDAPDARAAQTRDNRAEGGSGTEKVPAVVVVSGAVPPTVPPPAAPELPRTAAMSEVEWPAAAAASPAAAGASASASAATRAPRRSRTGLWLTLLVVVIGGAAAAAFALQPPDLGPPPPQPRAPEPPLTQIREQTDRPAYTPTPTPVPAPPAVKNPSSTRSTPSSVDRQPTRTGRASGPGDAGTPLLLPIPPIALPPGFPPLPSALPTALPTTLPPIPSELIPPGLLPSAWPSNLPQIPLPPGYAPSPSAGGGSDSTSPTSRPDQPAR